MAGAAAYSAALALFCHKYVPGVPAFQLAFGPILFGLAVLAWRNLGAGTIALIFFVPLVNNLPYFFGLHEPLPVAPAALVLFLFYFLGVAWRRGDGGDIGAPDGAIARPLALFGLLVGLSAVITFLRYADGFPFLQGRIYERAVNRQGLTAGGALMSLVFVSLTYLSASAFFLIAARLLRSPLFRRRALAALGSATLLSLAFAVFQKLGHPALGNNPASVGLGLINGTLKDALSFGAYLAMIIPLFLGVWLEAPSPAARILAGFVAAGAAFVLVFTGSKAGVLGLAVGLAVFAALAVRRRRIAGAGRGPASPRRRIATAVVLLAALALAAVVGLPRLRQSNIARRFENSEEMLDVRLTLLWKPALRMMRQFPLSGVGIGAFIVEVVCYAAPYERPDVIPESAENAVLQVGAELGLIGLAAAAWIFAAIAGRIRRGLGRERAEGRASALLAGAVAAGAAFATAAQAHSFIGSYEIQYTFWLIVAFVFGLTAEGEREPAGGEPGSGAGPTRGGKRMRAACVAALAVYAGGLGWSSLHGLSLAARTKEFGLKREFGFYELELTPTGEMFQWTREYAGFPVTLKAPGLSIPVQATHPDIRERPVEVSFYEMERGLRPNRLLKTIVLSDSLWRDVDLALPEAVGREVFLLLTVSRTWIPLKMTGASDPRRLGVSLGEIRFRDRP